MEFEEETMSQKEVIIGRTIRWYNNYIDEVNFCKENSFDFMQIWFKDGNIVLDNIPEPKIEYIKKIGFPIIFHAVFTPADFELYGDTLIEMIEYLGDTEVIIHPVYNKESVAENTELELIEKTIEFSGKAKKEVLFGIWKITVLLTDFTIKKKNYRCYMRQTAM